VLIRHLALVYLILGLIDLCCSLLAFRAGLGEANPFLAAVLAHFGPAGFTVAKVALSLAIVAGLGWLPRRRALFVSGFGVAVLGLTCLLHALHLPRLL
jgi:hypothetical protein